MSEKRGPGRIFVLSACLIWIPMLAFLAKLAYLESLTGDPETGRLYFTDILYEDDDGNVTSLLGVITTFSYTFLLLSSFCSGALAYIQGGCNRGRDAVAFWGVCSVILFLAGLDERFGWHETVGFRLQIEDVWIVSVYPLLLLLAAWWGAKRPFASSATPGWPFPSCWGRPRASTSTSFVLGRAPIGFWRKTEARSFQPLVCFSFVLSAFWTSWTSHSAAPIDLTPPLSQ